MNRLDVLLATGEITYEQWVDGYSMFETLGWSANDTEQEIDKRWFPISKVS